MLSTLRTPVTAAAALRRPVAIRRADEGLRADLRAAAAGTTYSWLALGNDEAFGGSAFGKKPELCRMPSALSTLDPSFHQQEGDP